VRLEGLGYLKKSNDLIGNRTRDLPTRRIVPRPTTLQQIIRKLNEHVPHHVRLFLLQLVNVKSEQRVNVLNLQNIKGRIPYGAEKSF
jgi:hypothetical protein